jgi:hypothetical protein
VQPPVDLASLPPQVQKLADESGPAPLRKLAARGLAPGLRPEHAVTLVVLLAEGADAALAADARATLDELPAPLLAGALTGDLPAGVLDVLAQRCAGDVVLAERVLAHKNIAPASVARMARSASEPVCELIATNEERLLAHPEIIERLYLNGATRMSTADRILELAARHKLELTAIPAYAQAAAAIADELIAEPTDEPTFDDVQFSQCAALAESTAESADESVVDSFVVDEATGEEAPRPALRPLHAIWSEMRAAGKIRMLMLASYEDKATGTKIRLDGKALRMLGVRDSNPLVAVSALKAPGISDAEIERVSALRNVADDVLREIAMNRAWTRSYLVKKNLVANPRTPIAFASQWIAHMREAELRTLARSKDVSGAIAKLAKQQLDKKGK